MLLYLARRTDNVGNKGSRLVEPVDAIGRPSYRWTEDSQGAEGHVVAFYGLMMISSLTLIGPFRFYFELVLLGPS